MLKATIHIARADVKNDWHPSTFAVSETQERLQEACQLYLKEMWGKDSALTWDANLTSSDVDEHGSFFVINEVALV